jgi:hypothetical protein
MSSYSDIIAKISILVPSLSNTSSSSIWGRIAGVVGSIIDTVKLDMDNNSYVIESSARNLRTYGKQYYIDISLAYQDGDPLVVVDEQTNKFGYSKIDPSKQIVKQVSINRTADNAISVFGAKIDSSGSVIVLTPTQSAGFSDYITSLTPFGLVVSAGTRPAAVIDSTKLYIRYSETYPISQIETDVKSVLNKFQAVLRGDNPVYVNDIESKIEGVQGVRNAYFTGIFATINGVVTAPSDGKFPVEMGYFNFSSRLSTLDPSVVEFEPV